MRADGVRSSPCSLGMGKAARARLSPVTCMESNNPHGRETDSREDKVTPVAPAMSSFHIIVFSFNRAMQCESVLRSIRERVKTPRLTVSVVWRATGSHLDGYRQLRGMYEAQGVRFFEQAGAIGFFRHVLPLLWMPRNLYHWLKFDYVRKADNFKPLLEQVIAETPDDFVAFNTDDNLYYRDELLPDAAFRLILADPYGSSYRVIQGANLADCPAVAQREPGFLQWDYYASEAQSSWTYPFSVDGQFFERQALLSVIRRVLYHNPVTLESYTVGYVRRKRLFRCGHSPVHASMMALALNKVSFVVPQNTRGNLPPARLNELFLKGYTLEYEAPERLAVREVIPKEIVVVRAGKRLVLPLSPDEEGKPPVHAEHQSAKI